MKRNLYLVRHADSTWSEEIGNDFKRILTEEGVMNAEVMGERLVERKAKADLILTSPALRALETAKVIANALKYKEKELSEHPRIYEATSRTLIEIINMVDEKVKNLMLVGHNPAISRIVEFLTNNTLDNMPPAGIVHISFPSAESWSDVSLGSGKFEWYDYPSNSIHRSKASSSNVLA
jgi:phosphohistidine phosphatase